MATARSTAEAPISIDELDTLISNSNHDHLTDAIVASLGGIDKVLNEYIRITREYENEELLSESEMQNIANIIAAAPTALAESMYDTLYERAKLMDNTFHLSTSDTFLHALWSNHEFVDRLIALIFSKVTISLLLVALVVFHLILGLWDDIHQIPWFFAVEILVIAGDISYLILLMLSCNVSVFCLVISSFDFWMKLFYGISLAVSHSLYIRQFAYHSNEIRFKDMLLAISVFMVVAGSLIEGYAVGWKSCFGFGLLLSLFFSHYAIHYTLLFDAEEKYFEVMEGVSFGLLAWIGSAYRVLSLFLWKQTLMAAYTRGEWCICIYLSPCIKWTSTDH